MDLSCEFLSGSGKRNAGPQVKEVFQYTSCLMTWYIRWQERFLILRSQILADPSSPPENIHRPSSWHTQTALHIIPLMSFSCALVCFPFKHSLFLQQKRPVPVISAFRNKNQKWYPVPYNLSRIEHKKPLITSSVEMAQTYRIMNDTYSEHWAVVRNGGLKREHTGRHWQVQFSISDHLPAPHWY